MRGLDLRRVIRSATAEVDHFCEEWIGWSYPPPARVIEEARWRPVSRETYCRRCGESVGPGEATATGCAGCRRRTMPTDGFVTLGPYSEDLRKWILRIKYGRWSEMAHRLGRTLGTAIREAGVTDSGRTILVPMPMPWLRRTYRGIDHAAEIAAAAGMELAAPVVRLLARRAGPTQLDLPRALRRLNARRGMRMRWRRGGWPVRGLHIVIVDDVRTTGSSLDAVARLIRPLGPDRIIAAVLATTDSGRRSVKSSGGRAEEASAP